MGPPVTSSVIPSDCLCSRRSDLSRLKIGQRPFHADRTPADARAQVPRLQRLRLGLSASEEEEYSLSGFTDSHLRGDDFPPERLT